MQILHLYKPNTDASMIKHFTRTHFGYTSLHQPEKITDIYSSPPYARAYFKYIKHAPVMERYTSS